MADEDPGVERGRRILRAVAVSLIGSVVLVAVLTRTLGAPLLFQIALIGLLVYQTQRGRAWARWVLVIFCGYVAFGYGAAAAEEQPPPWLLVALTVVYVGCAAVLALSPAVRRFLEAQRQRP